MEDNREELLFKNLKYRLIGPFRGGRSGAVTGSYKNKNSFYFGATGGGVWKTSDGGSNWKNNPLLPPSKSDAALEVDKFPMRGYRIIEINVLPKEARLGQPAAGNPLG